MSSSPRSRLRSTIFVLLALSAGCNQAPPGPPLVPVAGVITLDGKPLAAADVMFVPQGETPGQGGVARTDAAGAFELLTQDRKAKGAPVGSYRVVVNKLVKPDGSDYVPDPNAGPFDTGGFKELLPATYSDMGQTRLEANIGDGGDKNLTFKLNSRQK
jgi:hypothetical protein